MKRITKREFVSLITSCNSAFCGIYHKSIGAEDGLKDLQQNLENLESKIEKSKTRTCIEHPTYLKFSNGSRLDLKSGVRYYRFDRFLIYFEPIDNSRNKYVSWDDFEVFAIVYEIYKTL